MKRILKIAFLCFLFIFVFSFSAFAESELYKDEIESLTDALDEESKELIYDMGIESADYKEFLSFDVNKMLSALSQKLTEKIELPVKALVNIILVSLLCSLILCFNSGKASLKKTAELCSVMCSCMLIISPIALFLEEAERVISACASFLFAAIPVYTALLYGSGKTAAASSYSYIALFAGNVILFISEQFVTPVLNIFLAFSVVSAISQYGSISKICSFFSKAVKVILSFSLSIFTAILTFQGAVSSNVDAATLKTAKFAASSFVPAVGSAVSDAMAAIYSSVNLLRSGAGAFGILAAFSIFAPTLLYYGVWKIICIISAAASEILHSDKISAVIKAAEKTLDLTAALLICCMVVSIIICAVVLSVRGSV